MDGKGSLEPVQCAGRVPGPVKNENIEQLAGTNIVNETNKERTRAVNFGFACHLTLTFHVRYQRCVHVQTEREDFWS